jgi:hypothetical protein
MDIKRIRRTIKYATAALSLVAIVSVIVNFAGFLGHLQSTSQAQPTESFYDDFLLSNIYYAAGKVMPQENALGTLFNWSPAIAAVFMLAYAILLRIGSQLQ